MALKIGLPQPSLSLIHLGGLMKISVLTEREVEGPFTVVGNKQDPFF